MQLDNPGKSQDSENRNKSLLLFGLPRLSACFPATTSSSKSPHPAHYMSFNQGLEHGLACGSVGWCWSVRNT